MSTNSKSYQVSQAIANGPDTLVRTLYLSGSSAVGDTTLCAAKANHYYMIVAMHLTNSNSAAITYTIQNATGGAPPVSIPYLHLDKGIVSALPFNPEGWFVTGVGNPLVLKCDSAAGGYNLIVREVYVPTKHPDLL